VVALQELVPRGFNTALYKLPLVVDDEVANLARFGVDLAATPGPGGGPAAGAAAAGATAEGADPVGGDVDGPLLCSLGGHTKPLLTEGDVRAALGGGYAAAVPSCLTRRAPPPPVLPPLPLCLRGGRGALLALLRMWHVSAPTRVRACVCEGA
jgi:hypothetical protein